MLFLADDIGCDGSNAANSQSFGKVRRREDSCQSPPIGAAPGNPNQPGDQNDLPDLGFNDFAATLEMEMSFFDNELICPAERFGVSNIPVCKIVRSGDLFPVLGMPWVHLRNVAPSTLHYFLLLLQTLSAKC